MEESQHRARKFHDIDNENSQICIKRSRSNAESQENIDPSSVESPRTSQQSLRVRLTSSREKSLLKTSPAPSFLLSEMGLDVLDSDESNQSSVVSSILSNLPQPNSAVSTIMSENSSEPLSHCLTDAQDIALESDSSTVCDLHHDLEVSESPLSDAIRSNPSSSDKTFVGGQRFSIHQDYTPANLVPISRTNFTGIVNETQPLGRPIRNTSMKKINKQESDSATKHKHRSPLATVSNNNNINSQNQLAIDSVKKQTLNLCDESFFMYQKQDPRIYTGEDNFARLSDEMILSIFKWLPKKALMRCGLVNQRFNRVAQDESLWTRLDLASKTIQPFAMGRILSRGVIIMRLAQCKFLEPIFTPNEISSDFVAKLQYLDLSMATISIDSLVDLFSKCKLLKKLSLEHVPINDQVCKELAANKHLEVLNLSMSSGITNYGAKKLIGSLKLLHTLNISWTSLDTETVYNLPTYLNENLQRLNIAGCRKTMTDETLEKLVQRCSQLQELDLSDCTLLSSKCIDIVAKLKRLEYLSLSRCYNINVSAYLEINKIASISYLDIFGVLSDQALTLLQETFREIGINKFIHSAVARPTVGSRRTSIWGLRTRD